MSDSRERFEAWCAVDGINVERQASGVYAYAPARVAWRSWQAAERDALERAAKVCDEWRRENTLELCCDQAQHVALNAVAAAIRALAGKE